MAPCPRLQEKLRTLGLSSDESPSSSSSNASFAAAARAVPASSSRKKGSLCFRIYFPLPPFDGIHFTALRAGQGAFNFTGQLLGVGGKQLQKIKQESSARLEVVNSQGNLNGAHPDPLDETLHARIEADSLAKLQRAADMVCQVLSPTNAVFKPVKVEPGGSARLTVVQPGVKAKAAAAHGSSKPKPAKPALHQPSSSASGKGATMPPSPALTPVTPASSGSRHGSMFAPSVSGSNSCCSSRAPTPGPSTGGHHASSSTRGALHEPNTAVVVHQVHQEASGSGFETFQLPPAALSAGPHTPLAADDWPALSSSAAAPATGGGGSGGSSSSTSQGSHSHNASGTHSKVVVPQEGSVSDAVGGASSSSTSSLSPCRSIGSGSSTAGGCVGPAQPRSMVLTSGLPPAQQPSEGSAANAGGSSSAAPAGWLAAAAAAAAQNAPATISTASSGVATEYSGGLSPLTPHAQQYHQQQRQLQDGLSAAQTPADGQGAYALAAQAGLQSTAPSSTCTPVKYDALCWDDDSSFALSGGGRAASINGGGGSSSSSGNNNMHGAAATGGTQMLLHASSSPLLCGALQFQPQPQHQQLQLQPGDLDLMLLRQRAGLVTQACLHAFDAPDTGGAAGAAAGQCGCAAGAHATSAAYHAYDTCRDSSAAAAAHASLMGPSGSTDLGLLSQSGAAAAGGGSNYPAGFAGLSAAQAYREQQDHYSLQQKQHQRQQRREQHMAAVAAAAVAAYHDAGSDGEGGGGASSLLMGVGGSLPSGGLHMNAPRGLGHVMAALTQQHHNLQQQQQYAQQPAAGGSSSSWSPATVAAAVSSAFGSAPAGAGGGGGGFLATGSSIW